MMVFQCEFVGLQGLGTLRDWLMSAGMGGKMCWGLGLDCFHMRCPGCSCLVLCTSIVISCDLICCSSSVTELLKF